MYRGLLILVDFCVSPLTIFPVVKPFFILTIITQKFPVHGSITTVTIKIIRSSTYLKFIKTCKEVRRVGLLQVIYNNYLSRSIP